MISATTVEYTLSIAQSMMIQIYLKLNTINLERGGHRFVYSIQLLATPYKLKPVMYIIASA